jgi:hypothetical protein
MRNNLFITSLFYILIFKLNINVNVFLKLPIETEKKISQSLLFAGCLGN